MDSLSGLEKPERAHEGRVQVPALAVGSDNNHELEEADADEAEVQGIQAPIGGEEEVDPVDIQPQDQFAEVERCEDKFDALDRGTCGSDLDGVILHLIVGRVDEEDAIQTDACRAKHVEPLAADHPRRPPSPFWLGPVAKLQAACRRSTKPGHAVVPVLVDMGAVELLL